MSPLVPLPPPPPERVLPTLNADGSRRWLEPRIMPGRFRAARRWVGWALIALFVGIPFLRVGGKPAVLLDVAEREFTFFGRTFLPTDSVLLMLLLLAIFLGVVLMSAVLGRAWCGWACPQTVYLEFVFRPVERLLLGDRPARNRSMSRRLAFYAASALLAVLVANVFLAWFVGVETLARWVTRSPFEHPAGFLVMGVTAGLAFFDFTYFREQMCTVICPYARLQSVLLDPRSLVVGYDPRRGEPRAKGKDRQGKGDCIDCRVCVAVCPTGIDIRDGLQLECVACTACIDACDTMMDNVGSPRGLIRYGTVEGLRDGQRRGGTLRPRVLLYAALVVGMVAALLVVGSRTATAADVTVLRGLGAPFVEEAAGVRNQVRVKIENRTGAAVGYTLALEGFPEATLVAPENPLVVPGGEHRTTTLFITAPRAAFPGGRRVVTFRVTDGATFDSRTEYPLLGPLGAAPAPSR